MQLIGSKRFILHNIINLGRFNMDKYEKEVLDNIEKYGCHIPHVLEEQDLPRFTYSIGINKTSKQPDIIIMGLKQNIAHWVINEYHRRIRAGEIFELDQYYSGFLKGFNITFKKVLLEHYEEYFGWGIWYNGGFDPTTSGIWPWDAEASNKFKQYQPMLYETNRIISKK
jgi:hypothetical protein